jgi:hypothetical protein
MTFTSTPSRVRNAIVAAASSRRPSSRTAIPRAAALVAEAAGLPAETHTFGETGVGTALMLQLHAAHRNFVLDNQTYYPNLEDDVILGGPLEFDGPFLAVPTAPGLGVELDRERVQHWARFYETDIDGRDASAFDDRYYDRDYLVRPRI